MCLGGVYDIRVIALEGPITETEGKNCGDEGDVGVRNNGEEWCSGMKVQHCPATNYKVV
jgi:hypothetical protein